MLKRLATCAHAAPQTTLFTHVCISREEKQKIKATSVRSKICKSNLGRIPRAGGLAFLRSAVDAGEEILGDPHLLLSAHELAFVAFEVATGMETGQSSLVVCRFQ